MAQTEKAVRDKAVKSRTEEEPERFEKRELVRAGCLRPYGDAAGALLEDGKRYTLEEAMEIINGFMKGKVE